MQPPGAGSLVCQQSPPVHSNAAQHALLFSADGSKTSNKSPTPDLSTHPKWAKEIFLETKSSCRASVLALGHSRSAISSRFGLLSRAQGGSGPGGCSGARPAQHPPRWPLCHPTGTRLPSTRVGLHWNCGTLCHRTSAIIYLLKKPQREWLQLSDDSAQLAREAG